MKPYLRVIRLLVFSCIVGAGAVCAGTTAPEGTVPVPTRSDNDAATRKGFDHFYNLEYDKSIHEFETAQQAHPDDPFAVNHLLSGVIFKELLRIGALDTEAYAGDTFLDKRAAPLDPKVRERVKQLTEQSFALSQARLDKNPNDVDALYARGVTRGLRATYMGLAEKTWFAALRSALAARHDQERVLELDPKYVDAKVVLGTHLYIVGSLSWPAKVAASVVGISGSKQKGLDDLREAVAGAHSEVADDARIILALFLRREQKYDEALKVVASMQADFSRNFLVAAEYAHLMNAAGHGQDAIAGYRKVIAGCHSNAYSFCHIEVPAYGLGEAMRGQRDYAGAAEAYELAASSSGKDTELRQKATLAADLARRYMKQAYKSP
jgi:tetratricopeptide (TPR) repeat protein